ncbi:MAG: hypothetical protein KA181_12410 [Xylophilus sp.]|nr:hypothetical protein [Xylophilus sp.]
MAATKKVDYARIEPGWRAGILSPRQLAAQYTEETGNPVSHAAIVNHFKKAGIDRDLAAKIRAKADAMVTQAMVTGKVTPQPAVPERQVIEDNATQIASVRISHRKDIARARSVAANLLTELELQTGSDAAAMLSDLGELMRSPDDKGQDKLAEIYQKVISLPGRVKTMKDLGDSMRVLIGLEREAYGIEGDDDKSQSGAQRKRVILDFVDVVAK